ncbi:hypothetical protein A3Q56_03673 [Intoshia linei]|uniref:tRNA (uracil(54)-C(5))-methyltransferase n=1 Tax=Intoshia linei TaxID=1819745 RepID=A0A177B2Q3_9BILA|nr:hypothetical protein A3Q56_03673 [Intoshia linei]
MNIVKVENLPNTKISEIQRFFKKNQIKFVKIKPIQDKNFCYVIFREKSDETDCLEKLKNKFWKNKLIKIGACTYDSYAQEGNSVENLNEIMMNNVTPLHNVEYKNQLEIKKDILKNAFKDIDKDLRIKSNNLNSLEYIDYSNISIIASPVINGYRNKAIFSFYIDDNDEIVIGFRVSSFKNGYIQVSSADKCKHISYNMKFIIKIIKENLGKHCISVFNPIGNSGRWNNVLIRESVCKKFIVQFNLKNAVDFDKNELIIMESIKSSFIESNLDVTLLVEFQESWCSDSKSRTLTICGSGVIHEIILGLTFRVSPTSFLQINTQAGELLYKEIERMGKVNPDTVVLDLCCGTGTIGIILSSKCKKVIGIETNSEAINDAKENCIINNVNNCEYYCDRVENAIWSILKENVNNKLLVILDPPRAGLNNKLIQVLRNNDKINQIIYVSCKLSGAKQNLVSLMSLISNKFKNKPFTLKEITGVDLFPHTNQIETVMLFERCI